MNTCSDSISHTKMTTCFKAEDSTDFEDLLLAASSAVKDEKPDYDEYQSSMAVSSNACQWQNVFQSSKDLLI